MAEPPPNTRCHKNLHRTRRLFIYGRIAARRGAREQMQPYPWLDVIVILALIVLNGFLAMSELAIVSSRRPRLRGLAAAGKRGASTALTLSADPGRFLSSAQIGITLVAILNGAFSADALAGPTGDRLQLWLGLEPKTAQDAGLDLSSQETIDAMKKDLSPQQAAPQGGFRAFFGLK